MASLQEMIHSLEQGAGRRLLLGALTFIGFLGLGIVMDTKFVRNMSTAEGMEAAQLARNIAEGHGYVTGVMRPLAIHLTQTKSPASNPLIREPLQPDLQNPPLYPVLLAGWLKLNPFSYRIQAVDERTFRLYRPDLWVAIFNQLLLAVAAVLVFLLAQRLFDPLAGWMSVALFLSTWLFWQFTFTGHSTLLLLVLVLLMAHCLVRAGEAALNETPAPSRILPWGILAGVCVGLAALTRYSAVWLIVPVALYLAALLGRAGVGDWLVAEAGLAQNESVARGGALAAGGALLACLLILTPWVVRNLHVSGVPFGTTGYALYQGTETFPTDTVERSLYPKFDTFDRLHEVRRKTVNNVRDILFGDLLRFMGGWMGIFFVVGLLVPFRRALLNRFRWFVVMAMATMIIAMAAGRTPLSMNRETADLSSENLVVLISPLAFIFGVGLLLSLVSQMRIAHPLRQKLLYIGAIAFCSLPMLGAFIPPLPYVTPIIYPPYYPPFLQRIGRLNESGTQSSWAKEVVMSDVASAITWYSRCPSMVLSLNYRVDSAEKVKDDFFELNDYRRTIKALYLTQNTLKTIPVKGVVDQGRDIRSKWDNFIGVLMTEKKLPPEFPLQNWADGIWPEQLYTEFGLRR